MVRENYVIPIAFAILSILDKKQLLRCKYSMVWMASASHLWRSVSVVFLASAVRGGFSPGITGQWTVLQPEEFEKDGSNSTKIHGKRKFIDLGLLLPMLSRGCRFCIQASTLKREFTEALNTPLGKPLWGSTLLPIKNQHLTSKTNFAITSKPREPHPQPLAPHDRGAPSHAMSYRSTTGDESGALLPQQQPPHSTRASTRWSPWGRGSSGVSSKQCLLMVSPHSRLPRPNGGAQLQAFRDKTPHPTTTRSTTSTAGLVVSSQTGTEEEPATISKEPQEAGSGQDQSGAQGRPNWRTAPWRLKAWLGKEILTGSREQCRPQGSLPAAALHPPSPEHLQDSSTLREKPQNAAFGATVP